MASLLFILLYYNMYKKWDIIQHSQWSLRIWVVLRDVNTVDERLYTETIAIKWHQYPSGNPHHPYIFRQHCQWNVEQHHVIRVIWNMTITDNLFKDDLMEDLRVNASDDDDWLDSEEEDD